MVLPSAKCTRVSSMCTKSNIHAVLRVDDRDCDCMRHLTQGKILWWYLSTFTFIAMANPSHKIHLSQANNHKPPTNHISR